ncbi:uncharacterized protein LOC143244416 isoform X4 [Tachypleus tridentatus]|uniref:uncharacterized protein LOC143244416 isoform X4 n=1 Tax=Tachypleus tridentatus TaxID=6853 RepID=UPI003FD379EB
MPCTSHVDDTRDVGRRHFEVFHVQLCVKQKITLWKTRVRGSSSTQQYHIHNSRTLCLLVRVLWSTMSSPKKEDLPAVPSAMKDELASFNSSHLKHAETQEKQCLPSKEEIILEKGQQELLKNIQSYNPSNLRPTETVEKNPLPTKDVIDLEKSAA